MKLCNEKNDYFALNFKWLKLSNRSGSVVRGFLESVFDFFNKLRKNISLTIHSTEDFKVQNSTEAQFSARVNCSHWGDLQSLIPLSTFCPFGYERNLKKNVSDKKTLPDIRPQKTPNTIILGAIFEKCLSSIVILKTVGATPQLVQKLTFI